MLLNSFNRLMVALIIDQLLILYFYHFSIFDIVNAVKPRSIMHLAEYFALIYFLANLLIAFSKLKKNDHLCTIKNTIIKK